MQMNHSVPQSIRTCPVRISRPLHRKVKMHAAKLGLQIQTWVEQTIRKALK